MRNYFLPVYLFMFLFFSCSIDTLDKKEQIAAIDGINCWDLNQNGRNDSNEDINGDGIFNVLDCRGLDGADGEQGENGSDGADGNDGEQGEQGEQGEDGNDGADARCFVFKDDIATFQEFGEGTIVERTGNITVFAERTDFNGNQAMVFDTNNNTGNDGDLDVFLGNVLIISEDNDSQDPDDNADGGIFYFNFDFPVNLESVDVVDIENNNSFLEITQLDGTLTVVDVPNIGNNEVRTIHIDIANVVSFTFDIRGSGAIDNIATSYKEEIECNY